MDAPLARHAFQFGNPAIFELQLRTRDEVFDRARHEHLARSGNSGDTRTDVNCDPADLSVDDLALARMQADTDVEAEPADRVADRASAADRPRRAVERREEAIAGRVHLGAAEAAQLAAY